MWLPVPPPQAPVAAIEVTFSTHAGEGAVGRKRVGRDGCYQSESEGGTGGGGRAHDSEAGCHRADDVARAFALISVLPLRAAGVPAKVPGEQDRVVVVRADDTRWVPADDHAARELLRVVNDLPSQNQWYAQKGLSGGGVIMDNGPHAADLIRYLFGDITSVAAHVARIQNLEVEDTAKLDVSTGNHVAGTSDLSWSMRIPETCS
jgi:hypothetical protein